MKAGWERKRLADFATMVSTGPFGSVLHKSDYVNDGVPLVNPTNIVGERIIPDPSKLIDEATKKRLSNYVLKEGDIVVGRRGEIGRCAVVGADESGWVCGTGSFFIRPMPSTNSQFLAHLIRSDFYREKLEQASTGATMMNLSNSTLSGLVVAIPPLPEQQRIVTLLDEAFDGIATARAHAEKNRQNARAIFESHLQSVFAEAFDAGETVLLSDLATDISDGDHMPPPKAVQGVPFITIRNIEKNTRTIDFSDTFMVSRAYFDGLKANKKPQIGDILYTVTGSFGVPVLVTESRDFCFQRHIGLIRPRTNVSSEWLYYLLMSPQVVKQANEGATGTAQKTVSLKVLRGYQVPQVALPMQLAIVAKLDSLFAETQRLESLYHRKLTAFDELKKSLLHQAFSGQLSSAQQTTQPLPTAIATTTPEFTANVICFAYARHERLKREKTFGHVKEQKVLHLIESIAGIDLGRRPMKDAAGPNDFPHMLKAEEWAKAHGIFAMVKRDGGYDFQKLSAFNQHMSRAGEALAPYLAKLERVIDLLVPMDSEEAEVFATVHAAWNNLLIDQLETTDDAIVSAARQGWHAEKLRIPEYKFRHAIEQIRRKCLVPDGTAKYVGQPRLL